MIHNVLLIVLFLETRKWTLEQDTFFKCYAKQYHVHIMLTSVKKSAV